MAPGAPHVALVNNFGGAQESDRTMVDALLLALEKLSGGLDEAAKAARESANRTAGMATANAERSSYLNAEPLRGQVDPGAEAVARLFERLAGCLTKNPAQVPCFRRIRATDCVDPNLAGACPAVTLSGFSGWSGASRQWSVSRVE